MRGLLVGRGIEIGAGAFPQSLPEQAQAAHYDIRPEQSAAALFQAPVVNAKPMEAIPGDFPDGADFLIANNVLEHAPDPIGTLRNWNGYLRDGGVVILSLPHLWFCPDVNRQVPTLDHLIHDHLDSADGDDFSSREHAAAFILGWSSDFAAAEHLVDIPTFSQRALDSIRTARHDIHWHALDTKLSLEIVAAAAMFGGATIEVLKVASPELRQTVGDILIAYRIVRRGPITEAVGRLVTAARNVRTELDAVATAIEAAIPSRPNGTRAMLLRRPFSSEGLCAIAPIPPELRISDVTLSIAENGLPLGPAESLHDDIRRLGRGRFSIWRDCVYFSSSDGSDCNGNSRSYIISTSGS